MGEEQPEESIEPGGEPTELGAARTAGLAGLAVAGIALLLYLPTLPPTITFGGDCGELAAAAYVGGVAHPTGYPLYLLLLKLTSLLVPFGTIAWRMALFSAVAAAAAAGSLAFAVSRATDDRPAGLVAGLTLAVSATFWSQAVLVEVYALHLFLLAAILAALVLWLESGDGRWLRLLGLAFGLGLAHHVSTILFAPALFLVLLGGRPRTPGRLRRDCLAVVCWLLPPLLLYLYLPLRASLQPAMNWGATATWSGFLAHLTGREYQGLLGQFSAAEVWRFAGNHLVLLGLDLRWGALLALLGLIVGWRRQTALTAVGWVAGLTVFAFAVAYRVGDRANYVLPVQLLAALFAGLGAAWLRRCLVGTGADRATARHTLLTVVLVLLPLLPSPPDGAAQLRWGLDRGSLADNHRAADWARAVLADVSPGGAVLVLADELSFAIWYLQVVEKVRRDVTVQAVGTLATKAARERCYKIIAAKSGRGETFLAFWDSEIAQKYRLEMRRVTCRIVPDGQMGRVNLARSTVEQGAGLGANEAWRLLDSRLESPVRLPTASGGAVGLKPLLLARLTGELAAGGRAAATGEVMVVLVHQSLADELAGRSPSGPRVLNDSSGAVARWALLRQPLAPAGQRLRPAAGWVVQQAWPVALPERSLPGRWEVRLGLRGGDEPPPRTAAAAVTGSVRVGELVSFGR